MRLCIDLYSTFLKKDMAFFEATADPPRCTKWLMSTCQAYWRIKSSCISFPIGRSTACGYLEACPQSFNVLLRKVCYYSVEICAPLHGQIAIPGQKVRNWPQLQDDSCCSLCVVLRVSSRYGSEFSVRLWNGSEQPSTTPLFSPCPLREPGGLYQGTLHRFFR